MNIVKITDVIYFINRYARLKFITSLGTSIGQDRNMWEHFHKEYEYEGNYSNTNMVSSITRNFSYFLSIDINVENEKENIMIRSEDYYKIRDAIKQSTEWFTNEKYSNLFARRKNQLVICESLEILVPNITSKYIKIIPIIIGDEVSGMSTGVRMYINSTELFIDVTVDKLMGLFYTIDTFNMYLSASLMLNYVGKPEEVNRVNINSFTNTYQNNYPIKKSNNGAIGRKIPGSEVLLI